MERNGKPSTQCTAECSDGYGHLLSAIFETPSAGRSEFVTSTPKQASTLGTLGPAETLVDNGGYSPSPCAKEKRRYGKEWSDAVPRNRRNVSLGSSPFKAFPSPSSSTHSLYVNSHSNLGQWFSKDPPSQSSSLDSLTSYYCGKLGPPERLPSVNVAASKKPIICDLSTSDRFCGGSAFLSGDASVLSAISDPDLRAYNELSTSTYLKSAPVWEKLEKRHGGNHNRSHSLASPPSGALKRRQTTRRHAIYGGTGLPGIPVPYDDPEETRVNPARVTIASFDSNKAVCAISENSFSESPTKHVDSPFASLASDSPTKPLLVTPLGIRRLFNHSEEDSDLSGHDMSFTAVSSSSCDDLGDLSPVKKGRPFVLPLKIRTSKRRNVEGASEDASRRNTSIGHSKSLERHLPMMLELLDLVDEVTKIWDNSEDS